MLHPKHPKKKPHKTFADVTFADSDVVHRSGPFSSPEAAERFAMSLASRGDRPVQKVTFERFKTESEIYDDDED